MSGLASVNLQAIAPDCRSLAVNLQCCAQDLADEQSLFVMQRVQEQVQRIRAMIPVPVALADCDLLARTDLSCVLSWIHAIELQLRSTKPPFQVRNLWLVYEFASKFDVHADRAARRVSTTPPLTELVRQELLQKYGATEYLRRRWADEPDDSVARINDGIVEALQ